MRTPTGIWLQAISRTTTGASRKPHRRKLTSIEGGPSKVELDEGFLPGAGACVEPDSVMSYERKLLQLGRQSRHHAPAKSRVLVREDQAGQFTIEYRGRKLGFTEIDHKPQREPASCVVSRLAGDTTHPPGTILGDKPSSLCKPVLNRLANYKPGTLLLCYDSS